MSLLETRNLCRSFGGLHACDNVSVRIESNEIFGIIGPNGAGKTTFLNLCAGTLPPDSGEIIFNGKNIAGLSAWKIARRGIARTFQNIKLFNSMTVHDNVAAGFHTAETSHFYDALFRTKRFRQEQSSTEKSAFELLHRLGLGQYKDVLAKNLSYGMQRKVEIARSLAARPELLLLDEPSAGMNPVETKSLLTFIKMIRDEGYTVVLIDHDIKFIAEACSRIMVMHYGKKICEDTVDVIYNDERVIEAYFGRGKAGKIGARHA
ncbi:MAG: ABC transporter ATP-binding protein [Spirochaetaceae bacterium]|jgi:branched-chain amino acid transport system ATP-binding protein|nr:ABC transporter ATP-binding protein [Spirochaetaceae bacterium]